MTSIKKDRITLRLTKEMSKTIREKAATLGISVNAYISMVLAKETK